MNSVQLYGNLTANPTLTYTPSQMAVCKVDIAVNRKYKGEEEVSYFSLVAFGKTAELINQHFGKGRPILVNGRLQQDRWETKDGQKRSKVVVIVDNLTFTGTKGGGQPGDAQPSDAQPAPPIGGSQEQRRSPGLLNSAFSEHDDPIDDPAELLGDDIPF